MFADFSEVGKLFVQKSKNHDVHRIVRLRAPFIHKRHNFRRLFAMHVRMPFMSAKHTVLTEAHFVCKTQKVHRSFQVRMHLFVTRTKSVHKSKYVRTI